jgi:Flp pilus assembly protein TadG
MKYKSEGQSLVEFALLLPIMMLLMLGVLEVGRAIFITIKVTNGATAGAVYGSQNPTAAQDSQGITTAVTCDINTVTFRSPYQPPTCNSNGSIQVTTQSFSGCYCANSEAVSCSNPLSGLGDCAGPSGGLSCEEGQILVECVQVTTNATFLPLFRYPGLPSSFQANGSAIMRVRK